MDRMWHRWPECPGGPQLNRRQAVLLTLTASALLPTRNVVERAIAVSRLFEERTMRHEANKRKDQALPLDLQADAAFCESIYLCMSMHGESSDIILYSTQTCIQRCCPRRFSYCRCSRHYQTKDDDSNDYSMTLIAYITRSLALYIG